MFTLVIQSVFPTATLLLLDEEFSLIDEKSWESDRDEVQKLPLAIDEMIRGKEIGRVAVVVGIGNFSSTRISVTIANILAMALKAELFEMELSDEVSSEKLYDLVKARFSSDWRPVKIAKPVYKTAPVITPSKKQKFNT